MWERNSPSFLNSRYLAVGVQQRAHREGFLQRRKEVSTGDTGSRALGRPGGLCGVISSVGFFFLLSKRLVPAAPPGAGHRPSASVGTLCCTMPGLRGTATTYSGGRLSEPSHC